MSRPSRRRTCSITTTCCSTGRRRWPSRSLADDIGGRFDHVLVDEYQDTNRLQASILLALKPDGRGLTVVGDDAQSIYSFRAATVRNILDFPSAFSPPADDRHARPQLPLDPADPRRRQRRDRPGAGALHQEPLDGAPIGRAAAAGQRARRGRPGPLHRRARAGKPRSRHDAEAAGGAVPHLQPQRPLEVELTRRNIPFVKFGGLKFLDSAHVKDMLAVLRFAQNPRDRVAGFRVMQLLPGVGPSSAQRVLDAWPTGPIR